MGKGKAISPKEIAWINQKLDDGWSDETILAELNRSSITLYRLRKAGEIRPANKHKPIRIEEPLPPLMDNQRLDGTLKPHERTDDDMENNSSDFSPAFEDTPAAELMEPAPVFRRSVSISGKWFTASHDGSKYWLDFSIPSTEDRDLFVQNIRSAMSELKALEKEISTL